MHFLLLLPFLFLLSCGGSSDSPVDPAVLVGPLTATGTVTATGASLYRRGTHLLLMDGRPRFFLESRNVDLSDFQDALVVVEGDVALNTSREFLPVMTVQKVRAIDAPEVRATQEYTISSLNLSLEAPATWQSAVQAGRFTFTLPPEEAPFVAIEEIRLPALPDGLPLRVGGQSGVRVVTEETGVHQLFVQRENDRIMLFTFGPKGESSSRERDAFYTMLRTVRFPESAVANSEEPKVPTGSGQPCGGTAGVVCPAGEYCAITEMETGIGKCRGL